jgi:hypothetical protein
MISVEQLIGDLLVRHNCVIVPAFGGFVANQTSAMIDYKTGTMFPPKKSLLFNRQLINNDGLLISEFALSNNISYQDAQITVSQTTGEWLESLKRGERVLLDKVGHLYFDAERNICFEQDRFFNLLLQSYGLGKVHFISEEDVQAATTIKARSEEGTPIQVIEFTKVETNETDPQIIPHLAIKKRTKVWRYVAAACLLPIGFYSFWIPMRTDVLESGMISIKDFNPFYTSVEGVYTSNTLKLEELPIPDKSLDEMVNELPSDIEVLSFPFDDDMYIPIKVREKSTETNITDIPNESPQIGSSSSFHFIVGCFGNSTNAENLVKKLSDMGLDAKIAGEVNGLTRVSAGSASSESALQEVVRKAQSLGFSGWVLKN